MGASTGKKTNGKGTTQNPDVMDPQVQLKEIQQLLFGEQIANINQTIERLDQQNQKRFDSTEKLIKQSIDSLQKNFNSKLDELSQHVTDLDNAAQNRAALTEDEVSALQHDLEAFRVQTESAQDSLEKLLFSEVEKLAKEMNEQNTKLTQNLENSSDDLSDRKTDRKVLAELLSNMATSLVGEPG